MGHVTDLTELRRGAGRATLDRESLLQIPLVRRAFCDLSFRFQPRHSDVRWSYEGHVPIALTGFNPFELTFYYGQDSRFAAWLSDPFGSAREFNDSDLLVKEVLFMTHDYLHAWTYSVIDRMFPALRVLHGAITADTFEDYVFCHLLSETVATIGLDYWSLCVRGVNAMCAIGSNVGPLTVSYREALLPEYRRFCPDLEVQTPAFFRTLATFYCTGEFPGFDADDLRRSPQLLSWLRHELSYGETQRALTRRWLAYLADVPIELTESELGAPLAIHSELRQRLVDEVGQALWAVVKQDAATGLERPAVPAARHAALHKPPDFRFINLARIPEPQWAPLRPDSEEHFKFFLHQLLAQHELTAVPERLLKHIPVLLRQRDAALALDLLRDIPRRSPLAGEPRDLMIPN